MIRQPGRQIVEMFFGHMHSEEYKPVAQVMKRMVEIYKENECTLRKPFPATYDAKFKLRFTTIVFQCSEQEPSRRAYAFPAPWALW